MRIDAVVLWMEHQVGNLKVGGLRLLAVPLNRPFLSSPQSLFQGESKCEIFVMIISSTFNINENRY